jgi:hypothetical protein
MMWCKLEHASNTYICFLVSTCVSTANIAKYTAVASFQDSPRMPLGGGGLDGQYSLAVQGRDEFPTESDAQRNQRSRTGPGEVLRISANCYASPCSFLHSVASRALVLRTIRLLTGRIWRFAMTSYYYSYALWTCSINPRLNTTNLPSPIAYCLFGLISTLKTPFPTTSLGLPST